MPQRFIYLHGFASGAQSRKARFFSERLAAAGYTLEIPELSGGDFEHLTIGSQLQIVEELLQSEPVTLIGSSLGGYLAALYAARHPEVQHVLLLAPASGSRRHWSDTMGAEVLEQWRVSGWRPVYHYSEQRMRNLHYGFVAESSQWEPEPTFSQPGEIFHGTRDTVVPPEFSESYAARNPRVRLTLVDSDHELTGALDTIWASWSKHHFSAQGS